MDQNSQQQPQSVFNNPQQPNYGGMQQPLPNAQTILILGICSIVLCAICGIIGLVMANKEMQLYNSNPSAYTQASLSNVKTGKICSIISLILVGVVLLIWIVMVAFIGTAAMSSRY